MIDAENTKKTLEWLKGLCELAIEESRKGNTIPAHKLGSSPTTAYYFHNVHVLRTITPEQWALNYAADLEDIDNQRQFQEQQIAAAENTGKIKLLEDQNADLVAKLDELTKQFAAFVAAQPKPRKTKPAPAETEAEGDEPPAEPTGEGEQ
jgi:hypothetical protein